MNSYPLPSDVSIDFMEQMHRLYLENPEELDPGWVWFFKGFELARQSENSVTENSATQKEFDVLRLVHAYRQRGHLFTQTNPVRQRRKYLPTLDIQNFNLDAKDLDLSFEAGVEIGIGKAKLSEIIAHLQNSYCRSVGIEYLYIRNPEEISWLQRRIELVQNRRMLSNNEKMHVFRHLTRAVGFEDFIQKRFTGQKRFSLEGAEALIPALDSIIEHGALGEVSEIVMAMAHRGRLNVLANILKKPYENIFSEFMGTSYSGEIVQGDVKYHLGYTGELTSHEGKQIKLSLVPNPSHLEMAGAVAEGITRGKLEKEYQQSFKKIIPIVIHGDAAVAAQGIVYEIIQMSQLEGYKTGGTIHIVINNQVGFTTNYTEGRSSTYCTDVAKVTRCPVFHINGDDVEAVIFAVKMAVDYRQKFHNDVFIDLLCYRKHGHNEGDEPRFTQPVLYKAISTHPDPATIYAKILVENKVATTSEIESIRNQLAEELDKKLEIAKSTAQVNIKPFNLSKQLILRHSTPLDFEKSPKTGIETGLLKQICRQLNQLPEGMPFFKKSLKIAADRIALMENNKADWAMAEQLAFASLIVEEHPVRLSGQDSVRGTFSHRHSAMVMEDSETRYYPLHQLPDRKAEFTVYNSLLSEYGVLGFEYGYSLSNPNSLTLWEAQFGDFNNVAQPMIDQYLVSAEEKWGVSSGLTLLLPHGYEGQGSEHSSARIERFLSLCARNNLQIVNCTTPANFFHVLRRQLKRSFRVPLVIFTPKSLLRHPECISDFNQLSQENFRELIDDNVPEPDKVTRIVFCSGKIYYDLLQQKRTLQANDIALIRLEQLYPLPTNQILKTIEKYPACIKYLWVQEEPENMGPWPFINQHFPKIKLQLVSRQASASPAVGLHALHVMEQNHIMQKVFKPCTCELKNKYCGLQCLSGSRKLELQKQHFYLNSLDPV